MSLNVVQASESSRKKRVTILGSTGSIGCSTVDLIRRAPELYDVVALTAHSNVDRLASQAIELNAEIAVIGQESLLPQLQAALHDTSIETAAGSQAIIDAAAVNADWVMASIMGAAGLAPTLAAVKQGNILSLIHI